MKDEEIDMHVVVADLLGLRCNTNSSKVTFSFSVFFFLFSAGREKKGSLAHGILVGN